AATSCAAPVATSTPTPTTSAVATSTPTPTPGSGIYQIAGTVYIDSNKNGVKDASEEGYSGQSGDLRGDIYFYHSLYGGGWVNTNRAFAPGFYHIDNLEQNTNDDEPYYVYYVLPAGYTATYPPIISPATAPYYGVKVGSPCVSYRASIGGTYLCYNINNGFIAGLNFGIFPPPPPKWFQSFGSDIRWDNNRSGPLSFTNPIPSGKYASMPGVGGMPGVIFSGAREPDLGDGEASASPYNWKVGSFSNPEVFTDTHNIIPTSYRFLLETVDGSSIEKKGIEDLCSGSSDASNCILTPGLLNGVYHVDKDLTIGGSDYTFTNNRNYVILINGNLTIKKKIFVDIGSTAIFSAKGNITVDKFIGEAFSTSCNAITHAGCTIEGLYSADNKFIADGTDNCSSSTDKRLNVAGSVIANAFRQGGTFENKRNLCENNASYASVTFTERPDFML
ncbi:MAG: hypothetical protein Q8O68_01400, partial [Candidatus Daviesbacteria bacterium]|nr:hypothetical protein [Candidatus Daviesbacteria bacterium]